MKSINLITLHDQDWFNRQTIAGKCVASVLKYLDTLINNKIPNLNLLDLEEEAFKIIKSFDCSPTFYKYKGFPGKICLSVNKELVHGIPKNYILQEGDVVKFDLGATYEGAIADAAATAIYGQPKDSKHLELLRTCKEALNQGIKSIKVGKQIGCIGFAISKYVKNSTNFGLITNYGGHGINENVPHAEPFVANKAQSNEGVRIQAGMTLAIEPMVVLGEPTTNVMDDGWTVCSSGISAHFEHTIYITEEKVHVLTQWL